MEAREPWALARDPKGGNKLDRTLATLVRTLAVLAAMFEPVTPTKAGKLATRLGLSGVPLFTELDALQVGGRSVTVGSPLFPRVDTN